MCAGGIPYIFDVVVVRGRGWLSCLIVDRRRKLEGARDQATAKALVLIA